MDCRGCGFFLANPEAKRDNLCSVCWASHLAQTTGVKPEAQAPSHAISPLHGGVIGVRTLNQMGQVARETAASFDLNTMLCGWFSIASARFLASRLPASSAPPALTHAQLLQLCQELEDPANLQPALVGALRTVEAGRQAYAQAHPSSFLLPNVDEAKGPIISPTDDRTLRGFMRMECAPNDLSHWLRSQPAGCPIGLLRPNMLALIPPASAGVVLPPRDAAYLQESQLVAQGLGGQPRRLSDQEPWEHGWFVEVHPGSPCAAAAAAVVALPAHPEACLLAGAAVPLLPSTPSLPWILMVDSAQLDGHYNTVLLFSLVEEEEEGGGASSSGGAAGGAAAPPSTDPSESGLSALLRPGLYACIIESLPDKCKAHWKYGEAVREARAAVYGSHYTEAATGLPRPGAPPAPTHLAFSCPACNFDLCGACGGAAVGAAAEGVGASAAHHPHALTPTPLGGPGSPIRSCDACGQRMGRSEGAEAGPLLPVGTCVGGGRDGCQGPVLTLPGRNVLHLRTDTRQPKSTLPGY